MSVPLLLSKLPEKPGMAELRSCHEPGTGCLGFYRSIPLAASHAFLKNRTGQRSAVRSSPGSVRTTDSSQIDHGLQMQLGPGTGSLNVTLLSHSLMQVSG